MHDRQDDHEAAGIGAIGVCRSAVSRDSDVAAGIRVIDEKESVAGVLRIERQPEKATLVAAGDQQADVEKRSWQDASAVVDEDASALLNDEHARVAGADHAEGEIQPGGDRMKNELRLGGE